MKFVVILSQSKNLFYLIEEESQSTSNIKFSFRDIFKPNGEYCRVKKKECNLHYCWEKLKRGELDMERVR